MVCSPHQYTLMKMAMPVYQSARSYAPPIYQLNSPTFSYQGERISQRQYTPAALTQMDYNPLTQTQDAPLFLPEVKFIPSANPDAKKEASAVEINPLPTKTAAQLHFAPNLYSLPINYQAQPQGRLTETDSNSMGSNSIDGNSLITNLTQLIQRELLNLQLQVQHV